MTAWHSAFAALARGLCAGAAVHLAAATAVALAALGLTRLLRRGGAGLRHAIWMTAAAGFLLPFGAVAGLGAALGRLLPRLPAAVAAPDFSRLLRYPSVVPSAPGAAPHAELCCLAVLLWTVVALLLAARSASRLRAGAAAVRAPEEAERVAVRLAAARMGISVPVRIVVAAGSGAPAVAGLFRPVLLLPEGLGAHLDPAEFEAVLMHEMAHVRRRDNLTGAVARLAACLFWFYPPVWWLERKLFAEREFACDEMVLHRGTAPEPYASGLLKTCRLCWAGAPSGLAAAAGSHLTLRMEEIMSFPNRNRSKLAARLAAAGMGLALLAAPLAAGLWVGMQTPGQTLEKRKGAEFVKAEVVGTASNHSDPLATLSTLFSAYETPLPPDASPYARWLGEDVAYIIVPEERARFLKLTADAERQFFITQFWQRRNPDGRDAPRNRFKEEHYRRIRYTNERFTKPDVPGWKTDRGRLYIVMGPPDEMESHPSQGIEIWHYRRFDDTPDTVRITFHL